MSETFDARSNERIAESVRLTEERFVSDGVVGGPDTPPYFAKITALAQTEAMEDNPKRAKGMLFYYDSDAFEYLEVEGGWIFDDDSEDQNRTGDIYSEVDLVVDDIVEVVRYHDRTATGNQMEWLVQPSGGGGAERPALMVSGSVYEFGAIVTSPVNRTAVTEFTVGNEPSFQGILPRNGYTDLSFTADLPPDFVFVGDLFTAGSSNTYYTESYPSTVWAKANSAYAVGGIVSFDILDGRSAIANVLPHPIAAKLILQGYTGGSTASDDYFTSKYFAVSFDFGDGNFYLDHPVF